VQAGVELAEGVADGAVDGELVAARVDAELESLRQAELASSELNDGQVLLELAGELLCVAT